MEPRYIVALEIGSSKIKCGVGAIDTSGTLTVIAIEEEPISNCVRYGVINNVVDVENHVTRLIKKVENNAAIAPRKVEGVYLSLGGRSFASTTREASRTLQGEVQITQLIINSLLNEVRSSSPANREVINVLPCSFLVDNRATSNPIGTYGSSISATFNILTAKHQLRHNLDIVIKEHLKLKVCGYIVRHIAEADLVLSSDEKRLGCMFVDFGSETTTVSMYKNGVLQYLSTIPMGSHNITRDLTSLNVIEERAESMKIAYGDVMANPTTNNYTISDNFDSTVFYNYVQARAGEIVANICAQIEYAGLSVNDLSQGIIIVGRGAKLRNFNMLLGKQSNLQVRIGTPSSRIRIANSEILSSDNVDIIALLLEASHTPAAAECLKAPVKPAIVIDERRQHAAQTVTVKPEEESRIGHLDDDDNILDDDDDDTKVAANNPKGNRKSEDSLMSKLKRQVTDFLRGPDDDEEDDNE